MSGESQILPWNWSREGGGAHRAERQKRKHEEKFNKFSPHIRQAAVGKNIYKLPRVNYKGNMELAAKYYL